jgi:hypothetical protein
VIKIFLEGDFTDLNTYISAERTHRFKASEIKKDETRRVRFAVNGTESPEKYPVDISFFWHRKDMRTDPDNIAFATKFILDGLVAAGVLKSDGWKAVRSLSHGFGLDKENQGVEVTLTW